MNDGESMIIRLHIGGKAVGVHRPDDPVLYTHNMTLATFDTDTWAVVEGDDIPEKLKGYLSAAVRRAERRLPQPEAVTAWTGLRSSRESM